MDYRLVCALTSRSKHGRSSIATQNLTFSFIILTIDLTITFRTQNGWLHFIIFWILVKLRILFRCLARIRNFDGIALTNDSYFVISYGLWFVFHQVFIYLGVIGIQQWRRQENWGLPSHKDDKMMATRNPKVVPKRKPSKPQARSSTLSKEQGVYLFQKLVDILWIKPYLPGMWWLLKCYLAAFCSTMIARIES